MSVDLVTIPTVTAVGAAGSGAGSQSSRVISGMLKMIGVKQGNTPHANTDITITLSVGSSTDALTLLALTNYNTTTLTWYPVRLAAVTTAGVAITFDGTRPIYVEIPLDGIVTVTVAQGGSLATCDVYLAIEK